MNSNDTSSARASLDGEPPQKRRRASTTATRPPREVGLMRSLPGDKFSSFIGSASGIYFIRSVYGAICHSTSQSGTHIQTPESDIVPGEDDHLPSSGLWKNHEITSLSPTEFTFGDLVAWSGSYFANWHPTYPFLHAPAVLKYFEKLCRDRALPSETDQTPDTIILRSVMSMSLADRRQASPSLEASYPSALVFKSYDAAMHSLQSILLLPASIQTLQAALSVQIFLVSMLRLNAASRLGGLIIRMALQLGLHRCPNRYPSFSPPDRELRQRIIWSLYSVDRSICQSMGLPLSLRDDDVDVCYPSNEQHATNVQAADHRLRLVEFLARHAEIRGQIMELRNKSISARQEGADLDVVITAKLARWWNDVEEFIDSDENDPPAMSTYHRTVLTILYHESLISLNRPILASLNMGSAYNAALQYCIASSRSIISTLHKAIKPVRNSEQANPVPLLWHTFTWAVWMSTFILFYAANGKHVTESMVSRFAEKSLEILQHLSSRGCVWPAACAAAIRDLRMQLLQDRTERANSMSEQPAVPSLLPISTQRQCSRTPATSPSNFIREQQNSTYSSASHNLDWPPCRGGQEQPSTGASANTRRPDFSTIPQAIEETGLRSDHGQPSHTDGTHPTSDAGLGILSWGNYMENSISMDPNISIPSSDGNDPFAGFDIPFWIGSDKYSGMVNEWS
ncbi:hypothetical protein BS50DRAFT_321301 [Corynespora cassiicola Philippines]|uniref:Xylanolytic transcriptional activator regulatory domain-containing protein n=1 Tax=Corynespora cassiicola Philippines TaxID=1448308 RepID=A0A2T2NU69_CORCC|nr:hypothetical protein BS50DRAFT_321301 [Corynespora cassiicola Philippines]